MFDDTEFHSEQVAFDDINGTEVSTVRLARIMSRNYPGVPYETCVFYASGDNEVVGRYSTVAEALESHVSWVRKVSV